MKFNPIWTKYLISIYIFLISGNIHWLRRIWSGTYVWDEGKIVVWMHFDGFFPGRRMGRSVRCFVKLASRASRSSRSSRSIQTIETVIVGSSKRRNACNADPVACWVAVRLLVKIISCNLVASACSFWTLTGFYIHWRLGAIHRLVAKHCAELLQWFQQDSISLNQATTCCHMLYDSIDFWTFLNVGFGPSTGRGSFDGAESWHHPLLWAQLHGRAMQSHQAEWSRFGGDLILATAPGIGQFNSIYTIVV